MIQRNYLIYCLVFFFFLVSISFLATHNNLDPDFGWHIKTGELILERGIPYQDWYTYTMPTFEWIDHEWLTNIGMFLAYSWLGFTGLQLLFLVLYTAAFFIFIKPNRPFWHFALPAFVGYLATTDFLGMRPQLLTVLFVAIVVKIISVFLERNSRWVYFLPAIFLLWVNLHASFFAGLFILCVVLACEVFKKFRNQIAGITFLGFLRNFNYQEHSYKKIGVLAVISAVSFLVTLINPYGARIYIELFRTIGDSYLKAHIGEWFPLFFTSFNPIISLYIGLSAAFLMLFYKKIEFNNFTLCVVFFLMALSTVRYVPLFVIISLPVFIEVIFYAQQIVNFSEAKERLRSAHVFYKLFFIAFLVMNIGAFGFYFYDLGKSAFGSSGKEYYPSEALSFIKTLPLSENVFNEYGWGGYLIWQVPERKVFIDGRMPSWRQDGQFVFKDYVDILNARPGFEHLLQKYDVKIILVAAGLKNQAIADNDPKPKNWFTAFYERYFVHHLIPENKFYDALIKMGWKEIYQDQTTLILHKP